MQIRHPAPDERPRILVVEPNRTNLGVMARRLAAGAVGVAPAADEAPGPDVVVAACPPAVADGPGVPATAGPGAVRATRERS